MRLNFVLKCLLVSLVAASVLVLFGAPLLFELGFRNKFAGGLAVLPWTLIYCTWFGVLAVAQNYLWCAERAGLASLPLLVGLLTNVACQVVLLPRFGLYGAVWSTTIANFTALVLAVSAELLAGHAGRPRHLAVDFACLWPLPWAAGRRWPRCWALRSWRFPTTACSAPARSAKSTTRSAAAARRSEGLAEPSRQTTFRACLDTAIAETLFRSLVTMTSRRDLKPLEDRGPLRVMFLVTSLPVGGAETLLVNLVRRMDPDHFAPSICCLKELGPLGEELATETRVYSRLIHGKYDLGVVRRLARLLRRQRIDAVVTVGAGDKMFWGRIAARLAGVPVICSALHSTGWPDTIGRLNRCGS